MDESRPWIAFAKLRLAEDETLAREASGGTVTGEPGSWKPSPGGDEWEAHADLAEGDFGPDGDLEVLVALRPGLPRPPDAAGGYWGSVISWHPDFADRHAWVPEKQFRHMARHDPARALREIEAGERTLERHRHCEPWDNGPCELAGDAAEPPCPDMRNLLARWGDHPDYQQEWKPVVTDQ